MSLPRHTTNTDRPGVPTPRTARWKSISFAVLTLAALTMWVVHPVVPDVSQSLIGDPDTDAIRGMWGFDHVRRSILPPNTPIWSSEVNFPDGVLALVLPWSSALAVAPAGALIGPVAAYNLSIMMLLWSGAFCTAWLVRVTSGSWMVGAATSAWLVSQPMLLHALADGTPEHVAIWGVPAFLAASWEAIHRRTPVWGIAAGILAVLVTLDSPYHAIYTATIACIVLPAALWLGRGQERKLDLILTVVGFVGTAALGGLAIAVLFNNFPVDDTVGLTRHELLSMNAADLGNWWRFDFGPVTERDPSLAPTLIPTIPLWVGLILTLIGVPRSLPWLGASVLMVSLSFGLNPDLPAQLARWMRAPGYQLGALVYEFNALVYEIPGFNSIRFPRRWLVPAAVTLSVSAGYGLTRLLSWTSRWRLPSSMARAAKPLTLLLAASASAYAGATAARVHNTFPMQTLPKVEFTSWVATHEEQGGLITLPQIRPPPQSGKRGDMPVFANIAQTLSSSDVQYLQVLHGQATVDYPSLKTLVPMRINEGVYRLMRNWDDLTQPQISGRPIPRSAYDDRSEPARQRAITHLREAGLRFVVADKDAYGEEGLRILESQLEEHIQTTKDFPDGTGVRVYLLRAD